MFFRRINWFYMQTVHWYNRINSIYFSTIFIYLFFSIELYRFFIESNGNKTKSKKNRHFALDTEWKFYFFYYYLMGCFFYLPIGYYTTRLLCRLFYSTIFDLSGFVDNRYGVKKSEEQMFGCACKIERKN